MFSRRFGSWVNEATCELEEFDVLFEEDELLKNGVQAPELDWVSKSDEFLMKVVNGDVFGLDDKEEVPFMKGVLMGAFGV